MSKTTKRFMFTDARLRKLEVTEKLQRFYDEKVPDLFIAITPNNVRTFYLAYSSPVELVESAKGPRKRSRQIKLGRYPTLTIKDARVAAVHYTGLVANGVDPMIDRRERAEIVLQESRKQKQSEMLTIRSQIENHESAWRQYTRREKLKRPDDTVLIIKKHFGLWLDSPMDEITRPMLQAWINAKISAGVAPGTINRPLGYLGSIYKQCRYAIPGFTSNPFDGLQKPKENPARIRWFSGDETKRFEAALEDAPLYMQVLIRTIWNTGARKNEILARRWTDIVEKDGLFFLKLTDTKNGEDRLLPLPNSVHKMLLEWRLAKGLRLTQWMFPSPTRLGTRLSNVQKQWAKILADAQIEDFRIHDLRHDFATKSLANGTPPHVLQRLLGHKDISITLGVYGHVTPEEMHDAVERLAK